MKQEDKKKLMYDTILNVALSIFSTYGYEKTSMNQVCKEANVSKGIIYYYFKSKDDLYLACIDASFHKMLKYLKQDTMHSSLSSYLKKRMQFFQEQPMYASLFYDSWTYQDSKLKTEIDVLKEPIMEYNRRFLHQYLNHFTLKENIDLEFLIQYIEISLHAFQDTYYLCIVKQKSKEKAIEIHESMIEQWIQCILYGIIQEKE